MDKGIRSSANALFLSMLPQRTELGNTGFRKSIIASLMDDFSITLASAATHYNHAFKECKKANPQLVEGLGRAEDKKGGRKAKVVVTDTSDAETQTEVAPLLLTYDAEADTEANVVETTDVKLYNVLKKKSGELVLFGVTLTEAEAAVEKAAKGKKAALCIA